MSTSTLRRSVTLPQLPIAERALCTLLSQPAIYAPAMETMSTRQNAQCRPGLVLREAYRAATARLATACAGDCKQELLLFDRQTRSDHGVRVLEFRPAGQFKLDHLVVQKAAPVPP